MQALLKKGSGMLRPASPFIFQIQTIRSIPESKVFVKGLASTVDDNVLREAFSPYGEITEARVVINRATGRSKGFGFVTYEDYASCIRALIDMHQWDLHGEPVDVYLASPQGGDGFNSNIDHGGSETTPFSLIRAGVTSVFSRWRNFDHKRQSLAPGMVLLKNYLTRKGQVDIVNICEKKAAGPGGFFTPTNQSGHSLRRMMMCYGQQWDPVTRYEKRYRSDDGSEPPPIPDEFMSLVEIAIQDAYEFPTMRPSTCVANYYSMDGRIGLHQDCDESSDSYKRGLPVVSISIGQSAVFMYGHTRDEYKLDKVRLDSGDILIFGGKSRLCFHGVKSIVNNYCSAGLLTQQTGLASGRLNLTLREY